MVIFLHHMCFQIICSVNFHISFFRYVHRSHSLTSHVHSFGSSSRYRHGTSSELCCCPAITPQRTHLQVSMIFYQIDYLPLFPTSHFTLSQEITCKRYKLTMFSSVRMKSMRARKWSFIFLVSSYRQVSWTLFGFKILLKLPKPYTTYDIYYHLISTKNVMYFLRKKRMLCILYATPIVNLSAATNPYVFLIQSCAFFNDQRFHFYISQAPTPLNLHLYTTTKFPLQHPGYHLVSGTNCTHTGGPGSPVGWRHTECNRICYELRIGTMPPSAPTPNPSVPPLVLPHTYRAVPRKKKFPQMTLSGMAI
ncbi:uncharacterized protein [Miscanthus floridulus]|uniref:uncharacterized protein isoform X2 n=1 Tax=Miscanthus floridulus TaxID=154761 RepID=UPI00345B0245